MRIEYRLCVGEATAEDGAVHITYGVELWEDGERERSIPDVSLDYKRISDWVSLCNELELDPIHLDDVIEDFIS